MKDILVRVARGSYPGFLAVMVFVFPFVILKGTWVHIKRAWREFVGDIRDIDLSDLTYTSWKKLTK